MEQAADGEHLGKSISGLVLDIVKFEVVSKASKKR